VPSLVVPSLTSRASSFARFFKYQIFVPSGAPTNNTTMNDDKEPHSDSSESKEEKKEDKIAGDKNQKTSTLLPLARVKRIIKSDPDVKLISSDACFLVAKATVILLF
jgi:sorbitol-specific phosphotransferase system component IIBC